MTESKRISETANVGNIKQVDKPTKMVKTFDFFVFGFFFLFSFRSLIIRPKSINDGNIEAKQKKNLINIMRFYFNFFRVSVVLIVSRLVWKTVFRRLSVL